MKTKTIKNLVLAGLFFLLPMALMAQEPLKEKVKITFKSSMTCEGCVETLTKSLAFEKGVTDLQFDLEKNLITIEYKNWKTNPMALKKNIEKAGYKAEEVSTDNQKNKNE